MDVTKCYKCNSQLKENGSVFFCDNCKRIAFPYDDSKSIVYDHYIAAEEMIQGLRLQSRDILYTIEQKRINGKKLTQSENQIIDLLSKYDRLHTEISPRMRESFRINEIELLLYDYFPIAERVIYLLKQMK